jgi:flagellar hook protein FlgE
MNVNSVLDSGLTGVRQGIEGVEKAASDIVRAGTVDGADGTNDVIEPIIELRLYQRSVEASAQVVRTADEVLGTLLDTMA